MRRLSPPVLRVLALTNPTIRELLEMQYQFAEPFIVDSSVIASKLGAHATATDQAIAETFASYSRP